MSPVSLTPKLMADPSARTLQNDELRKKIEALEEAISAHERKNGIRTASASTTATTAPAPARTPPTSTRPPPSPISASRAAGSQNWVHQRGAPYGVHRGRAASSFRGRGQPYGAHTQYTATTEPVATRKPARAFPRATASRASYSTSRYHARGAHHSTRAPPTPTKPTPPLVLNGISFAVAPDGSRLARTNDASNAGKETPETATIAGIAFVRALNGDLERKSDVDARFAVPLMPCSLNPRILSDHSRRQSKELCTHFNTTGAPRLLIQELQLVGLLTCHISRLLRVWVRMSLRA